MAGIRTRQGVLKTGSPAISERKAGALLVTADPSLYNERRQLIELAARYQLPAIYEWRLHAVEGGLMSYGTVLTDAYSQVGRYAGRIPLPAAG